MSITDELREWWVRKFPVMDEKLHDDFTAIADRIDKEHAEAVADALQLRGEPDRWVKLPVDADGVPIHVGDELTDGENLPSAVCCMLLRDGGWTVSSKALFGFGIRPSTLRHVKPDSWEDIILDAVNVESLAHDVPQVIVDKLVERCRRLAGERA